DLSSDEMSRLPLTAAVAPAPSPAPAPGPGAKPASYSYPHPPATLVVDGLKRQVELNYVVIWSGSKKDAEDARDLLIKRGIPCTVERPPAGWASKSWDMFSVI